MPEALREKQEKRREEENFLISDMRVLNKINYKPRVYDIAKLPNTTDKNLTLPMEEPQKIVNR